LRGVQDISRGEIPLAIAKMRDQGRVHELANRSERIDAIARALVEHPDTTLVVAADNASRLDISRRIHKEMQAIGKVSNKEQTVKVLIAGKILPMKTNSGLTNLKLGTY
jgi:hypothetical protein